MDAASPYRILVIDDEQVVLDASARLLRAEGFEVITALDAERALELVEIDPPDLALVDLKLPGLSGLEFMDRALSKHAGLPVILTTGISSANEAVAALNHGAFDFLPKPFTYEELMSPILRACRDLQAGDDLDAPTDGELLFLGSQVWARPGPVSSMQLGVTDRFQRTAGPVLEIVLPKINGEIRQGGPLARMRTEDARWHVALAAAGGRVIQVNSVLINAPGLLNEDPFGRGWIAQVQSSELHRDLPNLRSR